jgi:N-ethylmaleimide reductase
MSDTDPAGTFLAFASELDRIGIGYIHLVEPVGGRLGATEPDALLAPRIRAKFNGTFMLNGGYDAASGNDVIEGGLADLVSFGVLFLANPDLPDRFLKNAPLNSADPLTLYTGEEKGYTDYPALGDGTPEKVQV